MQILLNQLFFSSFHYGNKKKEIEETIKDEKELTKTYSTLFFC